MAARSLGLAAAVMAVATNAFLLTPDMYTENTQPDLSTWSIIDPKSHSLVVPCQGCSADGSDSSVLLDLSIGEVPGTIELNGEIIYPVSPFSITQSPTVVMVPSGASLADIKSDVTRYRKDEKVISGLLLRASVEKISEFGDQIIAVDFDIESIGRKHVRVPHVILKVLKNPENRMMILSSNYAEAKAGMLDEADCTSRLCRLRNMIGDRLRKLAMSRPKGFKPCTRGRLAKGLMHAPSHLMNGYEHTDRLLPSIEAVGTDAPHAHYRHHHRHHHCRLRRFLSGFWRGVRNFGLPLLIGLVAGVLTYVVGMAIGCSILLLWLRFRRSRNGSEYDSVAIDDDYARKELDVEATPFKPFEDAPPGYEHAPEYEEKEHAEN